MNIGQPGDLWALDRAGKVDQDMIFLKKDLLSTNGPRDVVSLRLLNGGKAILLFILTETPSPVISHDWDGISSSTTDSLYSRGNSQ